jgi:hypothetical protein
MVSCSTVACCVVVQVMSSQQWTEKFVAALAVMNPPNVGVVGPAHKGGNTNILTYDFTSRKVTTCGNSTPSWCGDYKHHISTPQPPPHN